MGKRRVQVILSAQEYTQVRAAAAGVPLSAWFRRLGLNTAALQRGEVEVREMTTEEIQGFQADPPKIEKVNMRGTRLSGRKVPLPKSFKAQPAKKVARCPHGFTIADGFTACQQCREAE